MHIMKNHGRREAEDWLAKHGSKISEKIEQGYAAAQRGELIDSDEVRSDGRHTNKAY
jgi:hypothetical protein